jgi:hypothetical protein
MRARAASACARRARAKNTPALQRYLFQIFLSWVGLLGTLILDLLEIVFSSPVKCPLIYYLSQIFQNECSQFTVLLRIMLRIGSA